VIRFKKYQITSLERSLYEHGSGGMRVADKRKWISMEELRRFQELTPMMKTNSVEIIRQMRDG
jgi:hypothetical protein